MSLPNSELESIVVFEHTKRRDWGRSLLAWETKDKRGYVFENGQLRVLSEEFYGLMREVATPLDEIRALAMCLKPELDAARAERGPGARFPRAGSGLVEVEDQIAAFRAEYAEGFADPRWIEKQRRPDAKKRTRTQREPTLAEASEKLGADRLSARIADQAHRAIYEDVIALLKQTDLIPATELALITTDDPERQRALATMISDLCHGKVAFGTRFGHFLTQFQQTQGSSVPWQLATVLPALLDPHEQICVRPLSLRAYAKASVARLAIPKLPSASAYARCLGVVKGLSTKLIERGEAPADLFDVADFIHFSTQAVGKRRLLEKKLASP